MDEPQRLDLDDLHGLLHLVAHEPHGLDVRRPDLVHRPAEVRELAPWHEVGPVRRVAVEEHGKGFIQLWWNASVLGYACEGDQPRGVIIDVDATSDVAGGTGAC